MDDLDPERLIIGEGFIAKVELTLDNELCYICFLTQSNEFLALFPRKKDQGKRNYRFRAEPDEILMSSRTDSPFFIGMDFEKFVYWTMNELPRYLKEQQHN